LIIAQAAAKVHFDFSIQYLIFIGYRYPAISSSVPEEPEIAFPIREKPFSGIASGKKLW